MHVYVGIVSVLCVWRCLYVCVCVYAELCVHASVCVPTDVWYLCVEVCVQLL